MDRLIRECQSIMELNRIIDRGLDDETYRLAMDRFFELVLEGERDDGSAETATPANDADMAVSPENTAVMDDTVATSNDGYNRERNGPENNQDLNETIPSTSTGATSIADVINSMDDVESLKRIMEEDNWTTIASGLAFQRILQLGGINFDELLKALSNTGNEEMRGDNMAGGDNPVELDQNESDCIIPLNFVRSSLSVVNMLHILTNVSRFALLTHTKTNRKIAK